MSNPFSALSTAQLVSAHFAISKKKEAIEAAHKKAMQEELDAANVDAHLKALYYEIEARMLSEKTNSIDTAAGKVTVKTTVDYNVADLEAWADYVVANRDLSMFSKSLSKPAVDAYRKQNGDKCPPGLKAFARQHLQFKAAKAK